MKYADLFRKLTAAVDHATGHAPFPYQEALANEPWPVLLDIPTGLGKTLAVLGAWVHKRLQNDPETPRRLIYCLPMRVLVEQTAKVAREVVKAAAPLFEAQGRKAPTVHVLMGGDLDEAWQNDPTQEAILIGTQDMLLSRALNRGYAMSRYRWPMHFGLLNNDAMWVYDETQLLGVGLETSAQLEGLRQKHGTHGQSRSLWMSATLAEAHLSTVDHRAPAEGFSKQTLGPADHDSAEVRKRTQAHKGIGMLPSVVLSSTNKAYAKALAAHVVEQHEARGDLTLVVLNQVARAQEVFSETRALVAEEVSVGLLHSRFRGADRRAREAILEQSGPRIVVATQVVEAGVDLSAKTLISELCPWPSLVQRAGRCNRKGEYKRGEAQIEWIDVDLSDKKAAQVVLPYAPAELEQARSLLKALEERGDGAGPTALGALAYEEDRPAYPVVRRRDLLALFDTSSDLSGEDLDVSRYIRDSGAPDVFFYWREFDKAQLGELSAEERAKAPAPKAPAREELCRVGIGAGKDFLGKLSDREKKAWEGKKSDDAKRLRALRWDGLNGEWVPVKKEDLRPGMVVALDVSAGGYSETLGWLGKEKKPSVVPVVPAEGDNEKPLVDEEHGETLQSSDVGKWVLLEKHLGHVRDEARAFAAGVGLSEALQDRLATAGLWHDVGKAHAEFQGRLLDPLGKEERPAPEGSGLWAKSDHKRRSKRKEHRRYFRHELASMLAYLAVSDDDEEARDLVAYLVLAHHGKVRVSLRSLPKERPPKGSEKAIAHGVLDGDTIDAVTIPGVGEFKEIQLSLDLMKLGEGSWLERVLHLRDDSEVGPFRLAYLETLLRQADWKASAKEQEEGYEND